MHFTVHVRHDDKEGVWFVDSSDVPGLNAEASILDALVEAIADLTPDLIGANLPGAALDEGTTIALSVQHVVRAGRAHAA